MRIGEHLHTVLPMVQTFCDTVIAGGLPNQIIDRTGVNPYIERWMIGRKMIVPISADLAGHWVPSIVENIFVHRYGRADLEDMHDHPWDNASLIVRGWYREETQEGQFLRLPGDVIIRRAEDRHRIIDVEPGTISLFGTLPKRREWGFWEGDKFTHWREWEGAT